MKETSSDLLRFTYITSLIIIFLMTLLWMRDHSYETGIYIALGIEKIKIILYYISEVMFISIFSLIISLAVGKKIIYINREKLLDIAFSFTNLKFMVTSIKNTVIDHSFSVESFVFSCLCYLLIVVVTTVLSSIVIVNYNPTRLF